MSEQDGAGPPQPTRPASAGGRNGPARAFQADFLTALFRDPLDPGYGQAAAVRAEKGPVPARRRRMRRVLTAVTLILIGALLWVAYREAVAGAPQREQERASLIERIKGQDQRTEQLAGRAEELAQQVAALREQALSGTEITRLREFEAATGLRKVTGDGVVVTVSDGPAAAIEAEAVVSAGDLQMLCNELWAQGAEAIAINGQRLTSTTSIRKAGGAIHIGITPIVGPYEISAIGPDDLEDDFNASQTAMFFGYLRDKPEIQLGYSVQQRDDLILPAAVQLPLQFATVPATGSPTPRATGTSTPSPTTSPTGGR